MVSHIKMAKIAAEIAMRKVGITELKDVLDLQAV